jgi:uncharacterized protein (DUF305 family)
MKNKLFFSALALIAITIFGSNATFAQGNMQMSGSTDLQFLDMMTKHHSDGVKMAQMGVDKAQNAGVKALAQKMASGQQKDIAEMQKIRDRHFSGQPKQEMMMMKSGGMKMDSTRGGDMSMDMSKGGMTMEMMSKMAEEDMRKLEAASGAEFDRVFLDVFTKHHQMALDMSKEETSNGKNADTKKKAREIISVQTKELGEINRLKKRVGAGNTRAGR